MAPSWWMILALFLFVPTTLLIFLPLNWVLGAAVGAGLWAASVGFFWWGAPVLELRDTELHAGPARVDYHHIAAIEAIDRTQAREEKSVRLDARAFLVLRPWITPAVKITLNDPRDPTPYWLVSTRRPDQVVETWRAATRP